MIYINDLDQNGRERQRRRGGRRAPPPAQSRGLLRGPRRDRQPFDLVASLLLLLLHQEGQK